MTRPSCPECGRNDVACAMLTASGVSPCAVARWRRLEAERDEARAEVERLTKERDELKAWQKAVADGTGYVNYAEGQGGYEVADPETILAKWRRLRREYDARLDLEAEVERLREALEEVDSDDRLANRRLTTEVTRLHERLAALRNVAECQREACADYVRLWRLDPRMGAIHWHSEDAVRSTPLVTEGKP